MSRTFFRLIGMGLLAVFAFGCNGESTSTDGGQDGADGRYPDPSFVWEVGSHQQTVSDESFLQERPTLFRTTDVLGNLDVRTLKIQTGTLWAGTAGGLFTIEAGANLFSKQALAGADGPVVDLAFPQVPGSPMVVALEDRVELWLVAGKNTVAVPSTVTAVAQGPVTIWVGRDQGLGTISGDVYVPDPAWGDTAVNGLAIDSDDNLWIATPSGLFKHNGATFDSFTAAGGALPDDDVRSVSALSTGGVLAGCASGAALVGTSADRILTPGVGALPCADVTSVCAAGDVMFFGHGIGATAVTGDFSHVDHYHSLRWIPDERVTAVALGSDGTRWIGTPAGITRITLETNTLVEKAALYDSFNDDFWRLDFVSCGGRRDDPWDTDAPIHHHDHDNDGLWTQIQIVAWSYAGAATGDPSYCEKARRAMRGMMMQIDIPAVSFEAAGKQRGFVTRSFVREDEGDVYTSKATQDNWHLVEGYEGHDYYWKDDTSSDETTGHFFGYPVFYDLCAQDDDEKAELAEHAGVLARYIMENEFRLIDLDGERTTHGHWDLETLPIALDGVEDCIEEYPIDECYASAYGGGWLNAIEILGHMLAAYHMTGDTDFYDAYEFLLEHRYGELVDFDEDVWTVTKKAVANHSDHELAMLGYHTLIRYEANDERRQRWIDSLLGMYQWELEERNPAWSAIVAGFVDDGYHLEEAIGTLREWPDDWREWWIDNSHREDAYLDVNDRFNDPQFKKVFPYDEIRTMKWNGNPYEVADGDQGNPGVQAPWPWLLPYWMYRYHGVIQ